jgi:hypothetical protein
MRLLHLPHAPDKDSSLWTKDSNRRLPNPSFTTYLSPAQLPTSAWTSLMTLSRKERSPAVAVMRCGALRSKTEIISWMSARKDMVHLALDLAWDVAADAADDVGIPGVLEFKVKKKRKKEKK